MFVFILMVILSCHGSGSKLNSSSVFDDVLYEALLTHDIEVGDLEGQAISMNSTSYIPIKANQEIIRESKKSISEDDSVKSGLIDKLLQDQEKVVFNALSIKGIELQKTSKSSSEILGVLKVSKVFFSDTDNRQGLFYYEFICGGECGSGNLVFVELHKGKWHISEHYPLFVR